MSSQINASPDINDQLTKNELVKNEPEKVNIAAEDVVVALAAPPATQDSNTPETHREETLETQPQAAVDAKFIVPVATKKQHNSPGIEFPHSAKLYV
jgi:hypothetical protein